MAGHEHFHGKTEQPEPDTADGWVRQLQADQNGYNQGFKGARFEHDKAAAEAWLQHHGFPTLHITGIKDGKLVGRDGDHYVTVNPDGTETAMEEGGGGWESMPSGFIARLHPDGSGQYVVAPYDRSGEDLARRILKDRLGHDPTATQIANFERDILRANGQNPNNLDWFRHLRKGQQVNVPAGGGEPGEPGSAERDPPAAGPEQEKAEQKKKDQALGETLEDARLAIDLAYYRRFKWTDKLTEENIRERLKDKKDVPSKRERKGLEYLLKHFEDMRVPGTDYIDEASVWRYVNKKEAEIKERSGVEPEYYTHFKEYPQIPDETFGE